MKRWLPVVLAVVLLAVVLVALVSVPTEQPKPSLADRINAACKPGFEVADWTTGDEYRPVPEGIVRVTCARYDPQGGPVNQYDVAVTK